MAEANLVFSKIVALPKPSSWSQVYNAGRLFAVLSLKKVDVPEENIDSLTVVGKSILDTLEEEFFTLETKDLSSIKQAIVASLEKIPTDITASFSAAAFIDNTLYLFAKGGSKVFIKRDERTGTILESDNNDPKSISSSSGVLEDSDLISLATKPFLDIIGIPTLFSSLDNLPPIEIAETLAPKVHEKDDGGASALIIKYIKQLPKQVDYMEETKEKTLDAKKNDSFFYFFKSHLPIIKFSHSKKIFLTVAVVILIILISSIFFAVKKQNDIQTKTLFEKVYSAAQKKYDEGNSLLDLNKNLARDNLIVSKNLLNDNKNKFRPNSSEQQRIVDLLKKVEETLNLASGVSKIQTKEIKEGSVLLTIESTTKASFFTQDDKKIYFVDNVGVSLLDKKTKQSKSIIKNNSAWTNLGGIVIYFGNIYILDKSSNQILKFVAGDVGFVKTNYFPSETSLSLSNAVNMAIDGSIWVLFKDGAIQKFTKGSKDTFTISGIDKPLLNPTRIYTDVDTKNLYILDNGNGRIVVFNKDGAYQSQYQTDILKGAKDFEVLEKDKKIFVLAGSKIYEMELR